MNHNLAGQEPTMSEAASLKTEIRRNMTYPPAFATPAEERQERKRKLTAALRVFGKFGFDEGVAGHFTVRDPERLDHFWVNPFGRSFKQMRVSDLILVNHDGEIVEGDGLLNQAAFAIHSQIHKNLPHVTAAAHTHSLYGKAFILLLKAVLCHIPTCIFPVSLTKRVVFFCRGDAPSISKGNCVSSFCNLAPSSSLFRINKPCSSEDLPAPTSSFGL